MTRYADYHTAPDGTKYALDTYTPAILKKADGVWNSHIRATSESDLTDRWNMLKRQGTAASAQSAQSADKNHPERNTVKENIPDYFPVERIRVGNNFLPALSASDFNPLRESIEKYGIWEPLITTPADDDGFVRLLDGHHRLRIATALGIDTVPVYFLAVEDEQQFAIESAESKGRQLTQAYKALLAFEKYRPLIQKACDENKGGNPNLKKIKDFPTGAHAPVGSEPFSVSSLEERRGLRHGDLGLLNKAWSELCPGDVVTELWEEMRASIANGAGVGAAWTGAQGRKATLGKLRNDPKLHTLLPKAAATLGNAFGVFSEVKWPEGAKQIFREKFATALAKAPQELRWLQTEVILDNWPTEDMELLLKHLKTKLGGGK